MDDTINVRHYMRLFWRWRQLMGAVVLAAVVIAGLVAFSAPRAYEAVAILSIPPSTFQVGGSSAAPSASGQPGPNISEVLTPQLPSQSVARFAMLPGMLDEVTKRFEPGKRGLELPENFAAGIPQGAAPLVELRVRGSDPERAAKIANLWAVVVSEKGGALFKSEARQSFDFFNREFQSAQGRLNNSEEALRRFNASSRIGELQVRIQALTTQVAAYQSRLLDLSVSLQQVEAKLSAIRAQLREQPQSYTLTKAIITDPVATQAVGSATRQDLAALSHINFRSQELNSVYVNLNQQAADAAVQVSALRAERDTIAGTIQDMLAQLSSMQGQVATQQLQQTQLARTADNARSVYSVLLNRQQEAGLASSATQANPVKIALTAVVPVKPVPAHRVTTLALAGILGLFLAVGAVLSIEYFRAPSPDVPTPDLGRTRPLPAVAGARVRGEGSS